MPSADIDDLLQAFGTVSFSPAEFRRERALLERRFLMTYGIHAADIAENIRSGQLGHTELVELWIDLHDFAPLEEIRKCPPPRSLEETQESRT